MTARVEGRTGGVPALEGMHAAIARAGGGEERERLSTFADLLLARAPAAVRALGDQALAALVVSAFRFYAAPGPALRVRAIAPSPGVEGWNAPGAVLETVFGDRPFIVDTVRETLAAEGLEIEVLLHPILGARRDQHGRLVDLASPGAEATHESFLHVWTARLAPAMLEHLRGEVAARLDDIGVVTDDHEAMRQRLRATAAELAGRAGGEPGGGEEARSAAELLGWFADGALELLGWREYAVDGEGADAVVRLRDRSGLGLLRRERRSAYAASRRLGEIPEPARVRLRRGRLLAVDKTRAVSPLLRRTHMEDVTILERDATGRVSGLRRLLGLFSASAHADEASDVPPLRRILDEILRAEGALPDSHDWKAIATVFDALPKTELLGSTTAELRDDVRTIVTAEQGDHVVVSVAVRQGGHCVRVLVVMPPAKVSGEAAARVARLVRARLGGTLVDEHLHVAGEGHGHLFLRVVPDVRPVAPTALAALEPVVAALFDTWEESLRTALVATAGAAAGARLADCWGAAFPPDYRATVAVEDAAADVARLDALGLPGGLAVSFAPSRGGAETTLRVYRAGEPLVLADVLPGLEHLGLRVLGEDRVVVVPAGGPARVLHRFQVQDRRGRPLDVGEATDRLGEAALAVWSGRATDDVLNRLVLEGGLDWRAVELLRAYASWAAQAGLGPRAELWAALADHPEPAARLFACFAARFADSAAGGGAGGDAQAAFLASLEGVPGLRADRLLRDLLAAADATVRTNFFARTATSDVLALKLMPRALPQLPPPQPLFEIYVRAPEVEGVHLRAGRIARGGLRLSDRPEDFRTEVLGLMRTQTVKNALIVPTGAKGAFVRRGRAAPIDAYRTFVRALLELTDDLVDGRVVHPAGQVIHDGDDPYLVVAADKGTATFSDAANALAAERGFWLGDAFASGGSHGYDHKALGVTARGAWECVRTHFRTLGVDADTAPLTVIGIGDMSGDVFGNGLLCSPHLRLRAAFDHRHVFLDPDPDPARSVRERRRLFDARGGWDAYDGAVLSPGGMIVPREAKRVTLTPAVQAMLGLAEAEASGEALVRAVLTMEADLLWNGGIGTYVRAPDEADAAVGDPQNDGVRVTADALRVRVVAEGGNLGLTQRARVAFALRGGQVNTDAVDNSAGVDTSDHEVNLKICLQPLVASARLEPAERDRLLAAVRDEVLARVLAHNRLQSRLLGVDQVRSRTRLADFLDHAKDLERTSALDRTFEGLPDRDVLRARRGTYVGLTRPELAVLMACTKIRQQQDLLASALPDDPLLEHFLLAYFPGPIVERVPDAVRAHPLRREIIVTGAVGALVDACGLTFVHRLRRDSGASVPEAVRAWAIAWQLLDGAALDTAIETAAITADGEVAVRLVLEGAAERTSRWVLGHTDAAKSAAVVVEALAAHVATVRDGLEAHLAGSEAGVFAQRAGALERAGLPAATARRLAAGELLPGLLDAVLAARDHELDPREAARRYWALADAVDFAWLAGRIAEVVPEDRWQRRALDGLLDDVGDARRRLVARPLAALPLGALGALGDLVRDLRASPRISLAALLVVARELRRLADIVTPLARRERTDPW